MSIEVIVAYFDLVLWMSPGGTDFTHSAVCLTAGP